MNSARADSGMRITHRHPAALEFLDLKEPEDQTGHSMRSDRKPGNTDGGRSLPKTDAIIVAAAPATRLTNGLTASVTTLRWASSLKPSVFAYLSSCCRSSTLRSLCIQLSREASRSCAMPGSM